MNAGESAAEEHASQDSHGEQLCEREMAAFIVEVLHLERAPGAIASDEPLFRDGLGLDSIDALELSLAISKRYGVRLRSDDPRSPEIFANLRSLTQHIAAHRSI